MNVKLQDPWIRLRAFTLIEVVLAMGIFLITVLALVGLLGPAFKSVSTVERTDEVASVVDSVNAFLNGSPYVKPNNPNVSRFDAIYSAIQNDGHAVLFVYRWYDDANDRIRQEIGFENNQNGSVNSKSVVNANNRGNGAPPPASFDKATSSIYRVVLTASSAMLSDGSVTEGSIGTYPRYTLNQAIGAYDGNYLALETRIFAEDPDSFNPITDIPTSMLTLRDEIPIFTYDTAILRY